MNHDFRKLYIQYRCRVHAIAHLRLAIAKVEAPLLNGFAGLGFNTSPRRGRANTRNVPSRQLLNAMPKHNLHIYIHAVVAIWAKFCAIDSTNFCHGWLTNFIAKRRTPFPRLHLVGAAFGISSGVRSPSVLCGYVAGGSCLQ